MAILALLAAQCAFTLAISNKSYTASTGIPSGVFSSYYPVASGAEPQPVVYDPVLKAAFPYNLTDPDHISTNDPDPVYFPQPVANLTLDAQKEVIETLTKQILQIGNASNINSSCDKCLAGLAIAKTAAQLAPELVPDAMVNLCIQTGFKKAANCKDQYAKNTYGSIITQVLTLADVTGLDGQYICNYMSKKFCPYPAPTPLDTTKYFPKPRPANATKPKASGKRVKVVHLSDIHLDPRYKPGSEVNCTGIGVCCRSTSTQSYPPMLPAPFYGAYTCDSPYSLIFSALQSISTLTSTNKSCPLAWSIFTGDLTTHGPEREQFHSLTEYAETSVATMLKSYLTGPVYSALGNHDTDATATDSPHGLPSIPQGQFSWNYNHVSSLWQHEGWLDASTAASARTHYGGYSLRTPSGLRIISLNTDFWLRGNYFNYINTTNPDVSGQLKFLITELQHAEDKHERVWIIGHVPTGWDGGDALQNPSNLFYAIVERYSPHVIAGVFFGHKHEDEVTVFYDRGREGRRDAPLNAAWIGPSITPLTYLNSGFRLYEVDTGSWEVYDAYTFYARVDEFGELGGHGPVWGLEYSTREAYGPWPEDEPLDGRFWEHVASKMENNTGLAGLFNTHQGKSSVMSPKCVTKECAQAKACYIRSGSTVLGKACPQDYASVQGES
ncbi:Metallo-dependent phosphatase [Piedraia hortae CBS 480.64]|uniref:Sphingomyelin phosphodiesterase n=1 Tax=Piedraia hortae CBS 480.64 TaxID=1314780 RepID=A0A6A7BTT1_9PEZI|nr:Metallo-dependent phosphatase [Piedraia hortae CBS 480.64]